MAMIKCKMCGGDLTLNEGQTVAECEYCGSMQTVPVADDEKKLTLFARANRLRTACEFDKAAGVYESIVADFPEEAEAYWGLVLCKYGIEYVDDPATGRKIPTCHRSSFESVMEDSDFEQTLENADAVSRKIYREEAKQIEELRRGIVAVSNNEEPYDIFICYKETDEKGERTIDSVIAQDVYGALTDKGYRVFFSRISLEDKLGLEYEPYIFAALNSAKVMLAFGTDYEYYNAVWVKNEWGRYLKLMAKDKTKHLIPCFKGIDAYDMPKEFARLQAQDMGKVGAVQDLLRGIEKLLPKQENAAAATQETAVFSGGNPNVAPLMERGYMFLEDGDWDSADAYFEKVLDQEPKNARAYVGKLMAELRVHEMEQLAEQATPFDEEPDYQKAIRFADSSLRDALESYLAVVKNRMEEERIAREKREEEERRRKAAFRKKITEAEGLISAGYRHTGGLRSDGTVVAVGENKNGQCDVSGWADIVAISAGYYHTIGLKSNGTVTAAGESKYGQCDVSGWTDIVAIRAGLDHTVGLRSDGTVVAVGENKNGQCDVSGWTDIVAIRIGNSYTVGLKSDGTVVAVGKNEEGQCNLSDWTDIVAISAGYRHTVGLRSDGTVAAVGGNACGQCKVSGWTDIVAISAGPFHTVGLRSDGTVVSVGDNKYGQCNVSGWTDIVAISAGSLHTIGLRSDGTVVAVGSNAFGQCDVSDWKLFRSVDTFEQERKEAQKRYAEQAHLEAERCAEQARLEAERCAEQTRLEAECRAEQARLEAERRARRKAELQNETSALKSELAGLKGMFSGKRRKEIETRLAQIEDELKKL